MTDFPVILTLSIAGALVIIALGFYAGKLLSQLRSQRERQADAEASLLEGKKQHDIKIINSVIIIVRAMKEEQCDYSEGCWRLSVLIESLKTSEGLEQQFPAIFDLYNQIKHMQILDARKTLAKKDRMKQDLERIKAETSLYDGINQDLILLLQYAQERLAVLKST